MSEPRPRVLVVEDEPQMRRFLRADAREPRLPRRRGRAAARGRRAGDAAQPRARPARSRAARRRRHRGDAASCASGRRVPIIVLSARGREDDKVGRARRRRRRLPHQALRRERAARAHPRRAAPRARRAERPSAPVLGVGRLGSIERAPRGRGARTEVVHLTPIEYRLLVCLARNAGKVLTHRQILQEVWGPARRVADPLPARLHGPAAEEARRGSRAPEARCSPSPASATACATWTRGRPADDARDPRGTSRSRVRMALGRPCGAIPSAARSLPWPSPQPASSRPPR